MYPFAYWANLIKMSEPETESNNGSRIVHSSQIIFKITNSYIAIAAVTVDGCHSIFLSM